MLYTSCKLAVYSHLGYLGKYFQRTVTFLSPDMEKKEDSGNLQGSSQSALALALQSSYFLRDLLKISQNPWMLPLLCWAVHPLETSLTWIPLAFMIHDIYDMIYDI